MESESNRVFSGLRSSLRQCKLKTLSEITKIYNDGTQEDFFKSPIERAEVYRDLIALFADPSEAVQEKAIGILDCFIERGYEIDGALPSLFNLLRSRLGGKSLQEESEEIRLILVHLLEHLCKRKENRITFYLDDFLVIVEKCLADPFADVRVAACQCLIALLPCAKSEFFSKSDPIIDILIATFTHNQAKVRAANTQAMGYAIHYGNGKRVADVWRLMAQRVIDSHHLVRETALAVLHFWMTNLQDRYSYWGRFVPLLLAGLHDELTDLRTETHRLWVEIGERYFEENRDEIRAKYSLDDVIVNYPPDQVRPTLGCRALVQRIFFNVVPSVLNDFKDWLENIRIQSIRLLFQMLLHAENNVVILLDKIFPAICQVAKDENQTIIVEISACAKLIGHFIEPNIFCELLVERMEDALHLVILSGILLGVDKAALQPYLDKILKNLYRLSRTEQRAQQFYCLKCLRCIVSLMESGSDKLFGKTLKPLYATHTRDSITFSTFKDSQIIFT